MQITKNLLSSTLLPATLLTGLVFAADPFDPQLQPLGYIGPVELKSTDLTSASKAYRGWFENGAWQGDLIEYDVSTSGGLTTSIDLTGTSPKQSGSGTNWSAHVQFAANAAGSSHWDSGRKIITSTNGSNQVAFRWANLTDAQKLELDPAALAAAATSSDVLDHVRGDRSNEKPSGALRLRFSVMGDVVHSNPEYVGAPEGSFPESSYVAFSNANANRDERVYVGANDGMLHAFDATNGNEMWAYIPSMLIPKLSALAGTPYAHAYYVDGGITVQDVYFDGAWHTVLAGSLGAGGKGLYALDVTDPDMTSENLATGNNKKILWELGPGSDDDLGYIFEATTVTQLNDGNWYAINGNGVSSVNGVATLLLINIGTGVVTKLSTGSGSTNSPNGLSAPALVDTDGDGKADIAFAGDIDGDMWKFDLTGGAGTWNTAYKLYDGNASQPITTAPDVANHPQGGHLVLFGTGRLYTVDDITDTSVQSLYGIWDTGTKPLGTNKRLAQLLSADTDYFGGGYTEVVRTFTTTATLDYNTYKGWKVDLPAGERLVTPAQLRAGRLKTTITNPDGYANWLIEATFDEGGVASDSIYDLDRSGVLNTADRVDGNADTDFDDLEDIPMGWERPDGNMSQATIASLEAGIDTLLFNFLNPPLVPPLCVGSCTGGISGGHTDVDTDSNLLGGGHGGGTDGHVHEYDDKTNRTYIDYFDIFPPGGSKLRNVTEVDIDVDEEFIVLIANADWSPGGTLIVNHLAYNVVEYQRMIHKAMSTWNGTANSLKDPDGNSLVFSIASIEADGVAGGGGLSINFDSQAIIAGGLLPTNTGCVNMTNSVTNGRWRNGALIMQLVKASHFNSLGSDSALDRLTVQTPTDLKTVVVLSDGTQVELTEDVNGDTVIDGTSPAYEIYGGLIVEGADSTDEFLYEGSVFWHWDSGECYGDPNWEAEFILATQGVSEELYQELLEAEGFASFEELVTYMDTLEDCKDIKDKLGGCYSEYSDLEDLYNLGVLVENANASGGDDGGADDPTVPGGGLTGEPLTIEGGVNESGITSGPNFETGRRTWIDILPE